MSNIETAKLMGAIQHVMAEFDPKAKERKAADLISKYGDEILTMLEAHANFENAPTRPMRTKALRIFDGLWYAIERNHGIPRFADGYYDLIRKCIAIEEDVNDRKRNN